MASILKVDQLQLSDGSTPTAADLGLDVSGSVVQVQQTLLSQVGGQTISGGSDVNCTGLELTITPKYSNSHILVSVNIMVGAAVSGGWGNCKLWRNSSVVAQTSFYSNGIYGSGIENKPMFEFLDTTPTTAGSPVMYALTLNPQGENNLTINWNNNGSDKSTSFVTAYEIAQ